MTNVLRRTKKTSYATYGTLYDGFGNVLIPAVLEPANPASAGGPYHYYRYQSPEFLRDVFRTDSIPGHTAIEFHNGNFAHNTKDCHVTGMEFGNLYDYATRKIELCVLDSDLALDQFMNKMKGIDSFDLMIVEQFAL